MAIAVLQAELLGVIFELVAMGVYIATFIDHMKIMYRRRAMSVPYIYLLFTSITIFGLSLAHTIIGTWRIYVGFTSNLEVPNAPAKFFGYYNSKEDWARIALYDVITLESDLFFVYRTCIIWNRNYLISIIPFLLFLGDVAITGYVVWSLNHGPDEPGFATTFIASVSGYFFYVTLALTLVCTLLITYKLSSVERSLRPTLPRHTGQYAYNRLSQVVTIIVESAVIYSSLLIGLIITAALGSHAFFIFLLVVPPVIGLVFSSIIIRCVNPNAAASRGAATISLRFLSRNHGTARTDYSATVGSTRDSMDVHLEAITPNESLSGNHESSEKPKSDELDSV